MPVPLPQFDKKKKIKDLQPLFKKTFRTADYLYADANETKERTAELEKHEKKKEKKVPVEQMQMSTTKAEKIFLSAVDAKDAADYEETMVALLETVESKSSPDGPIVTMQEDLWQRFKRFSSSMITSRRECEKEMKEAKMKLTQYKDLGNLERRIAELQCHRIELIRELAQDEQAFASSFRLRSKLTEVLEQMDQWRSATKDMFKHIHNDKKIADMISRGIKSIEKHSHDSTMMNRDEHADRSSVFSEGRVIHRTTRMLDCRYYIITIYTHDQGCTEYTKDMPYSSPTHDIQQSIRSSFERGSDSRQELEGMAELLSGADDAFADPEVGRESVSPVYLIVLYDVGDKQYHMLEHLPAKNWADPKSSEEAVINHVKEQLYLKTVHNKIVPMLPGMENPMRQLWSGKREIEGDRPGLFQINIFELDIKTWLIRVHDHSLCKLYSLVLREDLIHTEDDVENADDDDGKQAERVALALQRLRFEGGVLSLTRAPPQEQVDPKGPMRVVKKTLELQSIRTTEAWPTNLVLNLASRLGPENKYMLIRASASPTKDMLGIIVYEPMSKLILEQIFTLSILMGQQIDFCHQTGTGNDLMPVYMRMLSALQASGRETPYNGADMEEVPDEESNMESGKQGDGKTRGVMISLIAGLGINSSEYLKVMEAMFKNLRLWPSNELSFSFDLPKFSGSANDSSKGNPMSSK